MQKVKWCGERVSKMEISAYINIKIWLTDSETILNTIQDRERCNITGSD